MNKKTTRPIFAPVFFEKNVGKSYASNMFLRDNEVFLKIDPQTLVGGAFQEFQKKHERMFIRSLPKITNIYSDINYVASDILQNTLDTAVSEYVGMVDGLRTQITNLIARGAVSGVPFEQLRQDIDRVFTFSKKKAGRIGASHIRMYNTILTREKHKNLGITEGIWTTSHDERVRPQHVARDGKTFDLDKGLSVPSDPRYIFPSISDYGCRCTYKGVLPI